MASLDYKLFLFGRLPWRQVLDQGNSLQLLREDVGAWQGTFEIHYEANYIAIHDYCNAAVFKTCAYAVMNFHLHQHQDHSFHIDLWDGPGTVNFTRTGSTLTIEVSYFDDENPGETDCLELPFEVWAQETLAFTKAFADELGRANLAVCNEFFDVVNFCDEGLDLPLTKSEPIHSEGFSIQVLAKNLEQSMARQQTFLNLGEYVSILQEAEAYPFGDITIHGRLDFIFDSQTLTLPTVLLSTMSLLPHTLQLVEQGSEFSLGSAYLPLTVSFERQTDSVLISQCGQVFQISIKAFREGIGLATVNFVEFLDHLPAKLGSPMWDNLKNLLQSNIS